MTLIYTWLLQRMDFRGYKIESKESNQESVITAFGRVDGGQLSRGSGDVDNRNGQILIRCGGRLTLVFQWIGYGRMRKKYSQ